MHKARPYLKNNPGKEDWQWSAYLASARLLVQLPKLPKTTTTKIMRLTKGLMSLPLYDVPFVKGKNC
jgi:hypothetical protein